MGQKGHKSIIQCFLVRVTTSSQMLSSYVLPIGVKYEGILCYETRIREFDLARCGVFTSFLGCQTSILCQPACKKLAKNMGKGDFDWCLQCAAPKCPVKIYNNGYNIKTLLDRQMRHGPISNFIFCFLSLSLSRCVTNLVHMTS